MELLPYRPKPQPDELFSSWLIRLGNGYRMQFCDFLQLLGLAEHLHNSDIDRLAPDSLVGSVCELTGTDPEVGRATLLTHRMFVLHNDRLSDRHAGVALVDPHWTIPSKRSPCWVSVLSSLPELRSAVLQVAMADRVRRLLSGPSGSAR